jgi:hypothetical protein
MLPGLEVIRHLSLFAFLRREWQHHHPSPFASAVRAFAAISKSVKAWLISATVPSSPTRYIAPRLIALTVPTALMRRSWPREFCLLLHAQRLSHLVATLR